MSTDTTAKGLEAHILNSLICFVVLCVLVAIFVKEFMLAILKKCQKITKTQNFTKWYK